MIGVDLDLSSRVSVRLPACGSWSGRVSEVPRQRLVVLKVRASVSGG
jgi:hypothetical protein